MRRSFRKPSSVTVEKFVSVDVETNGLRHGARVIEIALVTFAHGGIEEVWDTLVNPNEEDVGRVDLHGIQKGDLVDAPRFHEISTDVARRMNGEVVVGHNLAFDMRLLAGEMGRIGRILTPRSEVCTFRASNRPLKEIDLVGLMGDRHSAARDAIVAGVWAARHLFRWPGLDEWD